MEKRRAGGRAAFARGLWTSLIVASLAFYGANAHAVDCSQFVLNKSIQKGVESTSKLRLQYGFESEYPLDESEKLLRTYGPEPKWGIPSAQWLAMEDAARVEWVRQNYRALFPKTRTGGGLVKLDRSEHARFLPESLILDTTGNLEIVVGPADRFETWWDQVNWINENLGTGYMQTTVGLPRDKFFAHSTHAQRLGFFNYLHEKDTLEKLLEGAKRYRANPDRDVARSFNHPFVGPMTRLKQRMLHKMLADHSEGNAWERSVLDRISGSDVSFKYVGTTVYRPDIAGPDVVILEVRDAHRNAAQLLEKVTRVRSLLYETWVPFESGADIVSVDTVFDFAKFPLQTQEFLKSLFPEKSIKGENYTDAEHLALQVYRNFAYPLRNWDATLRFLGRMDLRGSIQLEQTRYLREVIEIQNRLDSGEINSKTASYQVQGALVEFADRSQLMSAFESWENLVRAQKVALGIQIKEAS